MSDQKFSQVLLLGNGINRAYDNGDSWKDLINELRIVKEKPEEENIPFPLRAILVSNDNVGPMLKEVQKDPQKKHLLYGQISCTQKKLLQKILDIGFDDILTTNYSYELESTAFNKTPCIKDWKLKKIQDHTSEVDRSEGKYLLHTYNKITNGQKINRIWHIHGEARKVDSIVLGHYYYGSLLFKYKDLLDRRGNAYSKPSVNEDIKGKSWLDAFILSDVYVLGFGFDLSEFDLWWLLNRKKRENAPHGSIYYYDPRNDSDKGKIELLKTLGVTCFDLGYSFRKRADDKEKDNDNKEKDNNKEKYDFSVGDEDSFYPMFYEAAIKDIAARVNR